MKKKVRVLVPRIVIDAIEQDSKFFGIPKEKLCNEILFKFSLKSSSNYQSDILFEEREYLQFNLNKENQRYYCELIKQEKNSSDSEIIREIFIGYAILYSALREICLYREKVEFLLNAMKNEKILQIDTIEGMIEGKVNKIFRCKDSSYLKFGVKDKSYYIGQTRVNI